MTLQALDVDVTLYVETTYRVSTHKLGWSTIYAVD
jgi:hypothetical protein